MVSVMLVPGVLSCPLQRAAPASLEPFPELGDSPVIQQEGQPGPRPLFSGTLVAEHQGDGCGQPLAASSGLTNTSSGWATVMPPDPILPPTATLNPFHIFRATPPGPKAGRHGDILGFGVDAVLSRQPVNATLSLRGRLVYSRLLRNIRVNSSLAGAASNSSLGVRPANAHRC